ncbi:flippase, partial [Patescibacteria group bacterium]
MSEKIINIAKNTSYFTFALILQKIISFTYFTILARNLVPEDLGKYYFAISFTTIFAIFIDLGLANVLTREVAKTKEKAQELFSSVLFLKFISFAVSMSLLLIIINLLNYSTLTRHLVYLSAVCMALDTFTLTSFAIIRGHHNLKFESITYVFFQLIVISLGYTFIKLNLGLKWLMLALISASCFNFLFSSSLLIFKWKIKILPKYNPTLIKTIISITIPFALYGILQRLYMYLDTVLLSVIAGDKYVGLYQIAFKIIFALQFLPMAFVASLYPAFANYWAKNQEQLLITFERAINYLIIISLPISIGIIVLADKIILLFKPEYTEAVLPLQIVIASLLFLFLNFPIGALLNACDRQKINTINMGLTLSLSVVLNLILINLYQAIGASITVLVTNIFMFILGLYWVPKIIKYRPKKFITTFTKVFFSVLLMALVIFYLKAKLNVFIVVIIGGIIYFSTLFILGGFKKDDVVSIIQS